MTGLDDPQLVADEYADDTRLRRRAAAFTGEATAEDARVPLVAAVTAVQPARILEVGCGWGELAEWVGRETGAEVVAVDLSPRMVELARERGVKSAVADVQDLPFADGEFDVAIAAWMLYHVPDLDRGIAELARVLHPGGRLVAATNSRFHLLELRELVGSGPSTLKFSREDGEEHLRRHFAHVTREDVDGRLEFAVRAEVEEYVRASISMSPFVANLPEAVEEPFFARRATSIFVADKAA
jgi:ubiquinone/menaquinone biosynthesis C-methylase UbiE